jgi:hypothetical protein
MQDADIYQVCRETSSWELILSNFNDPAEQEKIKVGMDDYYIIYGRIFLLINCQFFLFVITRLILNECMEVCPPWVRVVMTFLVS